MVYGTFYATNKIELKKRIRQYCKDYHPAGYGTYFKPIEVIPDAELRIVLNGKEQLVYGKIFSADYSRGDSCD